MTTRTSSKDARRIRFDGLADVRDAWKARYPLYHREIERLCRSLIPSGASVLEIGCGTGDLLRALQPGRGLGIDISPHMVDRARAKYPDLEFAVGDAEALELREQFDYVVLSDLVGHLDDVWLAFRNLHGVCHPATRVVVTYYSYLWEPVLRAAERLGLKMPQGMQNWLPPQDLTNLAAVTGFEPLKQGHWLLCPLGIPLVAPIANRVLAHLPGVRRLDLVHYLVARPEPNACPPRPLSCSVVVPCRNEAGNIENIVRRLPSLGSHTELIFVEGHSKDRTLEECHRVAEAHPERDIKVLVQEGSGKGDAVRLGFSQAKGDLLLILDADLSVAPEDLPAFFDVLASGKGEFVNGSRLVYELEPGAMRFLNLLGNRAFALILSRLMGQPVKDTLCGTKGLSRDNYL
ncbi:MAG TPA: bifunctional class I SAM-dependent methyltransferase/glycosyltransferase family 2 protein, partial [Candidatus Acidoferrum sp.]|nr:bifunctional class I SAM-dependent methyltransferase/glycosyltransferase family 2 protein [Candidatus Acidoferrum sp.]